MTLASQARTTQAPRRRGPGGGSLGGFVTVTDLAAELGITARTLRFYEGQGLIAPPRVAATRVYSNRERARMILILRGKQLGFSIREIRDYLDLYDADPKHETQTRALLERIAERREQLEAKRCAIQQALEGLDALERDACASLARADVRRTKRNRSQAVQAFEAGRVSSAADDAEPRPGQKVTTQQRQVKTNGPEAAQIYREDGTP